MKKIWIVLIILALVVGAVSYIYFKGETVQKEYVNVSIIASYEGIYTKTGIIIDGKEINTSKSYELIKMEKKLVTVKNKNIEGQNFYEEEYEYNLTENTRIDIELEKPQLPEIDVDYRNGLSVTLSSENFEDVKFCLIGSLNYIFLEADKPKIKKIEGFENYDSCYSLEKDLKDSEETVNINYTELSNPTELDYINMSIIDSQGNYIIENIK